MKEHLWRGKTQPEQYRLLGPRVSCPGLDGLEAKALEQETIIRHLHMRREASWKIEKSVAFRLVYHG